MRFALHRDAGGVVDGLLAYRTKLDWMWTNPPCGDLRVEELWAATEESEISLWRFCLEHDLMTRVTAQWRPADEAYQLRLANPRAWGQTLERRAVAASPRSPCAARRPPLRPRGRPGARGPRARRLAAAALSTRGWPRGGDLRALDGLARPQPRHGGPGLDPAWATPRWSDFTARARSRRAPPVPSSGRRRCSAGRRCPGRAPSSERTTRGSVTRAVGRALGSIVGNRPGRSLRARPGVDHPPGRMAGILLSRPRAGRDVRPASAGPRPRSSAGISPSRMASSSAFCTLPTHGPGPRPARSISSWPSRGGRSRETWLPASSSAARRSSSSIASTSG